MVIHTDAGGQRQRFKDTPFVFQEQRILACRRRAAGAARQVDRIFQLVVTPFPPKVSSWLISPSGSTYFPSTKLLSEVIVPVFPGFCYPPFRRRISARYCPPPAAIVAQE
jgi:hypothetical protein